MNKTHIVGIAILLSPLASHAAGSCNFIEENMFAGPFQACKMPVSAERCAEIGNRDDNRNAVHTEGGDCAMEDAVGYCDMGDTRKVYYEGNPMELEIGCSFAGGNWHSG